MSRGRVRSRLLATMASVTALVAMGLVTAAPASAAVACSVSSGAIILNSSDPGVTLQVQVRNSSGQIFVDAGAGFDATFTCPDTDGAGPVVASGIALLSTTTAITINADGGDQQFNLWLSDYAGGVVADMRKVNWGAINWTVNLGGDTGVGVRDRMVLYNQATVGSSRVDIVLGANGIDLNNDDDLDVTVAGVENFALRSESVGDDSMSAAGGGATGAAFTSNILGVDGVPGGAAAFQAGMWAADATTDPDFAYNWLEGGAGNDDLQSDGVGYADMTGGAGNDYINCAFSGQANFYDSPNPVQVNLAAGLASGHGVDTLVQCEEAQGSAQGDTFDGSTGDDYITPGLGDDTVRGAAGSDTVAYWDLEECAADGTGVVVDLAANSVTGASGTDTLSSIENADGSDCDDTLNGTSAYNYLDGDDGDDTIAGKGGDDDLEGNNGRDTVDYGWVTSSSPVTVRLDCDASDDDAIVPIGGDGDGAGTADTLFTFENAILTANDDSFFGNQFQNKVWPNGGQNTLNGHGGIACGVPLADTGGDTLDYANGAYDETGVEVNMAGGATAGDSAVNFEAAIGSAGKDNFTGNELSNTLKGRAGNDVFRGGSGDDDIVGAKGNDLMRGGSGDDNLSGGKGKKDKAWGGSGDDVCSGVRQQYRVSCEG